MSGLPKSVGKIENSSLDKYRKVRAELTACKAELRSLKAKVATQDKRYDKLFAEFCDAKIMLERERNRVMYYRRLDIVLNGGDLTKQLDASL